MIRGCGFMFLLWLVVAAAEWILLDRFNGEAIWWQALLLGLGLCAAIGAIWGMFRAARILIGLAAAGGEWRDGRKVTLAGPISALDEPLRAPLSGRPALLYEYEVSRFTGRTGRRVRNDARRDRLVQGMGMAPCGVRILGKGVVRLKGFTTPLHVPRAPLPDSASETLAEHLLDPSLDLGDSSNDGANFRWSELLGAWNDDGSHRLERVSAEIRRLIDGERLGREKPELLSAESLAAAARAETARQQILAAPDDDDEAAPLLTSDDPNFAEDDTDDDEGDSFAAGGALPPGTLMRHLFGTSGLTYQETIVPPEANVTAIGTWRSEERAVEIGGVLQHSSHRLSLLPPMRLFAREMAHAVVSLLGWGILTAAGHAYLYPEQAVRLTSGTTVAAPVRWLADHNRQTLSDPEEPAAPGRSVVSDPNLPSEIVEQTRSKVSGVMKETNSGRFQLVDGLAWRTVEGTTIALSDQPFASRLLATSPCPSLHFAMLQQFRQSGFALLVLDAENHPKSLTIGDSQHGQSTSFEVGNGEIKVRLKTVPASGASPERIEGRVTHRSWGKARFEVVVVPETAATAASEFDSSEMAFAYGRLVDATRTRDLLATFEELSLPQEAAAALAQFPAIKADLSRFDDLLLSNDDLVSISTDASDPMLEIEGLSPSFARFHNFYHVQRCGERLVLSKIALNPH